MAEAEQEAKAGEPEAEVRPEELTQGTQEPVWRSPFPAEVVETLKSPLDPNRVRRRKGRGGGQFEYLAGHDVKRRANEIFGFGNWGTKVVKIEKLGQVKIVTDAGKEGWHVGYMAVVQTRIRTESGDWVSYEDDGYGDGTEYGPAAQITARELALKEAVTDAFKRSCTYLGDQFGLVLYAKEDEKKRIERDRNADDSRPVVRVDAAGPRKPQSWGEAINRFDSKVGEAGQAEAWLQELIIQRYGVQSLQELSSGDRRAAFIGFASALMEIESVPGEIGLNPGLRELIAKAFAEKNDGIKLVGPQWALGPDEAGLPSRSAFDQNLAPEGVA